MSLPDGWLVMNRSLSGRQVVIAGGSGFLGRSLSHALVDAGARVVVLSRQVSTEELPWRTLRWDGRRIGDWTEAIDGADAVVNLAGRSVDCIKTPDHRDQIVRSRVESTEVLGAAMRMVANPPPVWVQMSTAHIVGDPPTAWCDEDSPPGLGLAPEVALRWEAAAQAGRLDDQRLVLIRPSFVVGVDRGAGGGALSRLGRLVRLGLGGRVGSGRQGFSWIHESDLNRLFLRSIVDESMSGPYIASSPQPVSQAVFMRSLRRAMGVPIGLPTPAWAVRIGAPLVLRTDPELALYGRHVVSRRLPREGFEFEYPDVDAALAQCVAAARSR